MKKLLLLIGILTVITANAQVKDIENQEYPTIDDYLGNTWMAKNLDVSKFKNGDTIRECKTFNEWLDANQKGEPAWCYYEFNVTKGKKYGKLYNWYAVIDNRGIAPEGWKLPNETDVKNLAQENNRNKTYSGSLVTFLTESDTWVLDCAKGGNESGFNALAAGRIVFNSSTKKFAFEDEGYGTSWWMINRFLANYDRKYPSLFNIYTKAAEYKRVYKAETYEHVNELVKEEMCKARILPDRFVFDFPVRAYDGYSVRCVKPQNYKAPAPLSLKVYKLPYVGDSIRLNGIFDTDIDTIKVTSIQKKDWAYMRIYDVPLNKFTTYSSAKIKKEEPHTLSKSFIPHKGIIAAHSKYLFVLYNYLNNKLLQSYVPNTEGLEFINAFPFNGKIYVYLHERNTGNTKLNVLNAETGIVENTVVFHVSDPKIQSVVGIYMANSGATILLKKGISDPSQNEALLYEFALGVPLTEKELSGKFQTFSLKDDFPDKVIHVIGNKEKNNATIIFSKSVNEHESRFQCLSFTKGGNNYTMSVYPETKNAEKYFTRGKEILYAGDWTKQESSYFVKSNYMYSGMQKDSRGNWMLKGFYSSLNEYSFPLYYNLDISEKILGELANTEYMREIGIFSYSGRTFLVNEWAYKNKPMSYMYLMIRI
ncbi:MAG: fibrobacter succinogenes major paralogous domain-containing protein [Flavobacteriales bacterium]|nr:fibrobacter succinogenes major paralogous domain-containing protein [Flavobacteriales bacterium]